MPPANPTAEEVARELGEQLDGVVNKHTITRTAQRLVRERNRGIREALYEASEIMERLAGSVGNDAAPAFSRGQASGLTEAASTLRRLAAEVPQ